MNGILILAFLWILKAFLEVSLFTLEALLLPLVMSFPILSLEWHVDLLRRKLLN